MKLKKFFSVLLSLTILASICAPCYAADIQSADISPEVQSQMLRILSSVEHEKDNYGLTSIDFSSIEIGSPIPSYKVQNGALSASDIQLIPLLSEGKLVSIFYVATLPDGEYYVQLSNELVSSIEAYSSSNSFAINPSLILTYLNAGYPLYGDFSRTGGAHAVVIRGVNSSTRTFSVMNPNPTTSGYTSGTFSSSNVLTFISGYSGSSYTLRSYAFPGEI